VEVFDEPTRYLKALTPFRQLDKNEGYRRKLIIEISETFTKIGTTEICVQQEGKAYEE
jgi:hypothetical protein